MKSYRDKDNNVCIEGTPDELIKAFKELKSKLKVKPEPGIDRDRTAKYGKGPTKR